MGETRTALVALALLCPTIAAAQDNYGRFTDLPIALENVPNGQGKPFRLTKPYGRFHPEATQMAQAYPGCSRS